MISLLSPKLGVLAFLVASVSLGGWMHLRNDTKAERAAWKSGADSVTAIRSAESLAYDATRAVWATERAALAAQKARVDTIVQRRIDSVPVLASFIPDSIRTLPAMANFIGACTSLARDCDSLRLLARRIDTVTLRIEWIDTSMVHAERIVTAANRDSTRMARAESARKVSKVKAAGGILLAALIAYFGGRGS